MKDYHFTGDKIKNHFTAYLRKFIRSKRKSYIKKKQNINYMEKVLEDDMQRYYNIEMTELIERRQKEKLLLKEYQGFYPEWEELSDPILIQALMQLSEEERILIYQHVFEEKTFKEMERLNGLADTKVKNMYYYAIRKIRKWIGGE